MEQQTYTKHASNALAAYRAYCDQDPAERRLITFIDILDSLFPPLSSSHCADDILLANLLMIDPNLFGSLKTPTQGTEVVDANHRPNKLESHEEPQLQSMPPQTTPHAFHTGVAHAASGMNYTNMAKQQSRVLDSPYLTTHNATPNYNQSHDHQGSHASFAATGGRIPAPQFLKYEPMAPPTPFLPTARPQDSSNPHLRPRPRPRPRPMPDSFEPDLVPTPIRIPTPPPPAPMHAPGPIATPNHAPTPVAKSNKGKGRAVLTPEILPSPSTITPIKSEPQPVPGYDRYPAYILPASALKALKSSGRESSPIDLCNSSDKADDDDNEKVMVMPTELLDKYEEGWEANLDAYGGGLEDGGRDMPAEIGRHSTTSRSSSPIDLSEIFELIDKVGKPVMDPEELRAFLKGPKGRHRKPWVIAEKGLIAVYGFHPDAPAERALEALKPFNAKQPGEYYETMSTETFMGARNASSLGQQSQKNFTIFKDIKHLCEVRGFSIDPSSPREHIYLAAKNALEEARGEGAPISPNTSPTDVLYFLLQGWYGWMHAKIGDHPNFNVLTRHSGEVARRDFGLEGPSTHAGEKRAREDENPLSPQARDATRLRHDADDFEPTHDPRTPVRAAPEVIIIDDDTPPTTRSLARNATPGPSTVLHAPIAPFDTLIDIKPEVKPGTPAKTVEPPVHGWATALLETCQSAKEFKDQLLGMRKTQLEIDARSVDNRYQLVTVEQSRMEQERIHRAELDEERAEREAAELEERINSTRTGTLFNETMTVLNNSTGVDEDIVTMLNGHLRQHFTDRFGSKERFIAPRSPTRHSINSPHTGRSGSVLGSIPGSPLAVSTPNWRAHTPRVSTHADDVRTVGPVPSATDQLEGSMSPSYARSRLVALDQLPPLRKPVNPTTAATGSMDHVTAAVPTPRIQPVPTTPGPATARVSMASESSTLPTAPPPSPASLCGPPTAPTAPPLSQPVIPTVSTPVRTHFVPAGAPAPHISIGNLSAGSGATYTSYMHGNLTPSRIAGNTAFSPVTTNLSRPRNVTTPVSAYIAAHPTPQDVPPLVPAPSPSLAHFTPGSRIHTPPRNSSRPDTPMHGRNGTHARDHTRRISYSGLGYSGLGHSGLVYRAPLGSNSGLQVNVNPQAVVLEHHPVEQMALDSNEISPTSDEFVDIGDDAWYTGAGA